VSASYKPGRIGKRPLLIFTAALTIIMLVAVATALCYFLYIFATVDDPYQPRPPSYYYEISVSGLDGFTTENGSAVIMMPLPAMNGSPLLPGGWWMNYWPDSREGRHGMTSLAPADTPLGPMLAAGINMTDYYESFAGVTPIPITPGQGEPVPPPIEPARIDKPWSFDDVHAIASGGIGQLDYPTSERGRQAVIGYLSAPLSPFENGSGATGYTTYVYVDPALTPINNDSEIRVNGKLTVSLNHNKADSSEEGARRFERHTFVIEGTVPGGTTGYVPVKITYSRSTGI
jgi:hypothetical protein